MASAKRDIRISLGRLLGWGIPILVTLSIALIGGTFALTRYVSDEDREALKTRLTHETQRANEAENKLKQSPDGRTALPSAELPEVTRAAAGNEGAIKQLAERLSRVEEEREQLIKQLSEKAVTSLDPNSELPVLLKEFSSDKADVRQGAAAGLFALKDPRAFVPLRAFFKDDPQRLRSTEVATIYEWYGLFFELDAHSTIEFLVELLGGSDRYIAFTAYTELERDIISLPLIDACRPYLESLALRSSDSFTRTRAKVLLRHFAERRATLIKAGRAQSDSRSMFDVILDIEKLLRSSSTSVSNQPNPHISSVSGVF